MNLRFTLPVAALSLAATCSGQTWRKHSGKPGPTGWRCHVIQPDPEDHGPDGINIHDWDGDGRPDLFVNYEEGKYSRLFFHPGAENLRSPWTDFIQFDHGKCEDSGIGDLDNDGRPDYIANGGWIYFSPPHDQARDPANWIRMTLSEKERRVPIVIDLDGDGLNDLLVAGQEWFKQPIEGKHEAANWKKFTLGENRWPMACIPSDLDHDGDPDLIVPDRGRAIFWYENPGQDKVTGFWEKHLLHPHSEPMFAKTGDLNGDGLEDLAIAGGEKGKLARHLIILLRKPGNGAPAWNEINLPQPGGSFPKGISILKLDPDSTRPEVLVIPKSGDLWTASYEGDPTKPASWNVETLPTPGSSTRKKMDNAWTADLDSDGDPDILTTEENGGWGVVWFENPGW